MKNNKKICILGLGYIGLPTAVMFANSGFEVYGVDVSQHVIDTLNSGAPHIEEPYLLELFQAVCHKSLFFDTKPCEADIYIIAVPTPVHTDHTADLTYVEAASKALLPYVKPGNLVIIESTIPPKTTDHIVGSIFENAGFKLGEDIYLAHCPERVIPGKILHEIVHNARIVGGVNEESSKRAADIYRTFVKGEVLETTAINAEMTKLMENTYRDVNIALANELVKISSVLKINPLDVIRLANYHPRVNILQPGPGVGGHCIAVDPYFIIEKAFKQTPLIQTARDINQSMPAFVTKKIVKSIKGIAHPKVAIFGVTYKGNVGDFRESPALEIIDSLLEHRIDIRIFDPYVTPTFFPYPLVSMEEALKDSDIVVVLADHDEFKSISQDVFTSLMKTPLVFDTKNCLDPKQMSSVQLINFNTMHHDLIG